MFCEVNVFLQLESNNNIFFFKKESKNNLKEKTQ